MDEKTIGQRVRERAIDTTVSGGVAGSVVTLGAHYLEPNMTVPIVVAWTVVLNSLGAAALKWLRLRGQP